MAKKRLKKKPVKKPTIRPERPETPDIIKLMTSRIKGDDPAATLAEAQPKIKALCEKYKIPETEWTTLEDLYCMPDDALAPFIRDIQYQSIEKYGLTRDQIRKWANGEKFD